MYRVLSQATVAAILVCASVWLLLSFGMLMKLLPDLTVYSDGFSNEKWARIRIGMKETEVLETLGIPLEITETGGGRIYRLIKPPAVESYPD